MKLAIAINKFQIKKSGPPLILKNFKNAKKLNLCIRF
jgi:hypothetical protein